MLHFSWSFRIYHFSYDYNLLNWYFKLILVSEESLWKFKTQVLLESSFFWPRCHKMSSHHRSIGKSMLITNILGFWVDSVRKWVKNCPEVDKNGDFWRFWFVLKNISYIQNYKSFSLRIKSTKKRMKNGNF